MNNYTKQEEFNAKIEVLKNHFSDIPESDEFNWNKLNGILMLKIRKNWTVISSNSNYQINSEHVKDIFPILSISDAFPHWRLEMKGLIHSSVLSKLNIESSEANWSEGGISYRHKIQNGYPYLQLTLEGDLRPVKNALRKDDQIFFLKRENEDTYFVLATKTVLFEDESFLAISKINASTDKTVFHISDIKSHGQFDDFEITLFLDSLADSGLLFSNKIITRFISSLITKPFVIFSGLSGSGKTKLAQAFAQWICQDDSQYCIVPVGADWTNREPLLGYPNALKTDEYIKPDNGALDVLIEANKHPELPYFLILDEMNLSHVERYFADFLSVMESKGEISLFAEGTVNNGVPAKLALPSNLFIIGTVNIDETTYMFSPKVLDRANAIEFRVTKDEIENFFANQKEVDMDKLKTQGASMAHSFLSLAEKREFGEQNLTEIYKTLVNFFEQLKKTGAEFGYRSATEIIRLINQLTVIDSDLSEEEKLDIAIMQKLLPKLHGSRRKLSNALLTLGGFCVDKTKVENIEKNVFTKDDFDFESEGVKYPISLEKISRMYKGAIENGFASYAEA